MLLPMIAILALITLMIFPPSSPGMGTTNTQETM